MSRIIVSMIAALVAAAGFTTYMPAIVGPVPTATATIEIATETPTATATAVIPQDTATPTPTATATTPAEATATNTPTVTPTATATTQPSGPCSCSADTLNCSNFGTHSQAQACFDFCVSQNAGDIHKLDQDNDGNACESLPGRFVVIR